MISKRIFPVQWFRDMPVAHLLNVHARGGVDRQQLQKVAAADFLFDVDIKPEPGHSFIHLISVGAGEYYGGNGNCFFKGAPVQTTHGLLPIEEICEGEPVLTHTGRYQPVEKVFVQSYSGDRVSFRVCGVPVPVVCTAEHPVLVIRREECSNGLRFHYRKIGRLQTYMRGVAAKAAFVPAVSLRPGDLVVTPLSKSEQKQAPRDPYILGLYLAEGCLSREYEHVSSRGMARSIVLSLSENDQASIDYLQDWRKREGKGAVAIGRTSDVFVRRLDIGDQKLARLCERLFGTPAKAKFIAAEVFSWRAEDKLQLLAGYFDGDGCADDRENSRERGAIRASTVSLSLAMDLRRLLGSVGIPASVIGCMNWHRNGCFGSQDNPIYQINISASNSAVLLKRCLRLKAQGKAFSKGQSKQQIVDDQLLSAVTEVCVDQVEKETRYNLAVAGDNSYVVMVAVHNCDWFNKDAHVFSIPHPLRSQDRVLRLGGGLEKFHSTFMKYGAVYREHANSKKGGKPQGGVVAETVNPIMHRGELIIKVANDNWADDLQKLANGEPVYWSMGCGVKTDACSYCGHRARRREEYCEHLRYHKLALDKEGNQVFAINDEPYFHDISRVQQPAERIAFALRKVANAGGSAEDFAFAEDASLYLPLSVVSAIGSQLEQKRAALLEKLSDMEKRLLARGLTEDEKAMSCAVGQDMPPEALTKLRKYPLPDLLSSLSNANCMLSPRDFVQLVIRIPGDAGEQKSPGLAELPAALRDMFKQLEESPDSEAVSDAAYAGDHDRRRDSLDELIGALADKLSLEDEPLRKRITAIVVRAIGDSDGQRHTVIAIRGGAQHQKEAATTKQASAAAQVLAREYAKYQLAFLADGDHAKYASVVALSNQGAFYR